MSVMGGKRVKLSHFAASQGLSYLGAYKLWKSGAIAGIQLPTGTILVDGWASEVPRDVGPGSRAAVYSRVSSSQNRDNLESQAQRMTHYCAARGYETVVIVKETGSGLNDARPKLLRLLGRDDWDVLVVEHKDRLTRFGFAYLELLTAKSGQRIEVVNMVNDSSTADTDDLMQDFVSVVTSFCTRLYGLRRSRRRTETLIKALEVSADAE